MNSPSSQRTSTSPSGRSIVIGRGELSESIARWRLGRRTPAGAVRAEARSAADHERLLQGESTPPQPHSRVRHHSRPCRAYIATWVRGLLDLGQMVAGRRYQFTGDFRVAAATAAAGTPARGTNLPETASELIGREADFRDVADLVIEHRLVTLVGAGGIGKTRLGFDVARQLPPRFPDGVFVAELGPLSSPDLVPATVATALGLTLGAGTVSREGIAAAVATKHLLLAVDNCEHLIEVAAARSTRDQGVLSQVDQDRQRQLPAVFPS